MNPSLGCASDYKIKKLEDYIDYKLTTGTFIPYIFLTETWLKPWATDSQVEISGYNCYRSDRTTRNRGGVALYIHQNYPVTNILRYDDNYNQFIACRIISCHFILVCLYRPPDCSSELFNKALASLKHYLDSIPDIFSFSIFIMGDFNFPKISWRESTSETVSGRSLLSFINNYFLTQHVSLPTRKDNILDLVITNTSNSIANISTEESGMSDHLQINIVLRPSVLPKMQSERTIESTIEKPAAGFKT